MPKSVPFKLTVSFTSRLRTCASVTGMKKSWCAISAAEQRFLEIVLHRVLAEPDAQQRAVEILAGDRLPARLAVDGHDRAGTRLPVEQHGHPLLRFLELAHDRRKVSNPRLARLYPH